ncbi:MAG: aminodeoxychorismate synthase component I [Flavobacteriales bacterium]
MIHKLHKLIKDARWKQRVFIFNSNQHEGENLVALGMMDEFVCDVLQPESLIQLQHWLDQKESYVFGFVTYDVKNTVEHLESHHIDVLHFPFVHFVRPQVVVQFSNDSKRIQWNESAYSNDQLLAMMHDESEIEPKQDTLLLQPRQSRTQYIDAVNHLKQHIYRGDIYEVNYCQEFFANQHLNNPYQIWLRLNSFTEAPFACYMQTGDRYVMCASPERFMQRRGNRIISQPIKGTIKRGATVSEDEALKVALYESEKERSENVMIVDLVRNDLSRFATKGSVTVDELFGIHTFKTVHHMVSTVCAEVKEETSFTEILRAMFPMGSMTGAPKVRAMQLIDEFEYSRRSLYSGTIGYINPHGGFDFNVVIRTLLCNNAAPYISCSVGSAITVQCEAESEYEECLLKAEAVIKALSYQ